MKKTLLFVTGIWFMASAPSYADEPAWNEWSYGNHALGFHGYVRSTAGAAMEDGDTMPMFIAPGAQSKYRLGNESDTYFELSLDYHYYLDGRDNPESRYVQLFGTISDYAANPDYDDAGIMFDRNHTQQEFIKFGNFFGDGVSAWFGRRFYDRHDIHMMDHYWLNTGQGSEYGGGFEDIPLGMGHLDIAGFMNRDRNVTDLGGAPATTDDLYTRTLDLRYRGIPTFGDGELALWAFGAWRQGNDTINYDDKMGFGLGGWHTLPNVMGGRNVTGLTYRHGAAMQQGLFNARAIREDQGYDLDEAWAVELNNDWLMERLDQNYSVQWATILRHEERGVDGVGGSTIDWVSTGVRPVYYLNDIVSIATEIGVDYVDNEVAGTSGFLGKGTVALQLSPEKGYFKRPVLRLFATGAVWSDDFEGQVANANPASATSYADDTSGATYGIQFEWWW